MMARFVGKPFPDAVDRNPVANLVTKKCTLKNDTRYEVIIVDYDGTRTLKPGESQGNWLFRGSSVKLIMKLPKREASVKFRASQFENRVHNISSIFEDNIRAAEMEVLEAFSEWQLQFNHPGGYEENMSTKVVTKSSWKRMQEKGGEVAAKVGGMITAIELSASFKAHTKLTRVDEFEKEVTKSSERTLKDPCYFWQEIIVVKTNQEEPFDELRVPTPHTEVTSTPDKPEKEKFVYCKGN